MKHYKITFFLAVFLFVFEIESTQAQAFGEGQFSLEAAVGAGVPLSGYNLPARSKYLAFPYLEIAGRQMINNRFGVRAHFSYEKFTYEESTDMSPDIAYTQFGLQGVVDIGELFNISEDWSRRVALLGRAGIGLNFADYKSADSVSVISNETLTQAHLAAGGTLLVHLSENWSLKGELTFLYNFSDKVPLKESTDDDNLAPKSEVPYIKWYSNVAIGVVYRFNSNAGRLKCGI